MLCRLLLASVLLTGATVQAQSPPFYPLGDGDTWKYERLQRYPGELYRFQGYRRVTVVGDTTIGTTAYRLARVEILNVSQEAVSTTRCAVRFDGTVPEWIAVDGSCEAYDAGVPLGDVAPATMEFYVGGQPYAGEVRLAGTPSGRTAQAVVGVGVVASSSRSGESTNEHLLLSASVGGVAYGATPSPTAWHGFQPLAVGDRRAYLRTQTFSPTRYVAETVTGTELVGGEYYFRISSTYYDTNYVPQQFYVDFVRHNNMSGCIISNNGDYCIYPDSQIALARTLMRIGSVQVGGQSSTVNIIRDSYNTGVGSGEIILAEGIGEVSYRTRVNDLEYTRTLLYARVNGTEYGPSQSWAVWANPTAGEDGIGTASAFAVTLAGPNPTRGAVALRIIAPTAQTVLVDAVDVLGRRVATTSADIAADGGTLALDLSGQSPGTYLVRVSGAAGARATVPVTVY